MRMRALTFLAAAVLGLRSALDQVAAATSSGDCSGAGRALTRASSVLQGLPDSVDQRLRARLRTGIANLRARVPVQCAEQATTTPTQTTTTPTQTTTTPTQTTTTPTQTTTTPTQTTTTPATPTTPDGGGTGGTGGTSAGGQG
jgi:hypothetical protein